MNQYQACLYLSECISHGDSKYGYEITKFLNFLNIFGPVVYSCFPHGIINGVMHNYDRGCGGISSERMRVRATDTLVKINLDLIFILWHNTISGLVVVAYFII